MKNSVTFNPIVVLCLLCLSGCSLFSPGSSSTFPSQSPDFYALLDYVDNPDYSIRIDLIQLLLPTDREPDPLPGGGSTLCSYAPYCRRITIGLPTGENIEGFDVVVGKSRAIQLELSNLAFDIMTNYPVEVTALTIPERDRFLQGFLESDDHHFSIEFAANGSSIGDTGFVLTSLIYAQEHISKVLQYKGQTYYVGYQLQHENDELIAIPNHFDGVGEADSYFSLRFYLADTELGESLDTLHLGQRQVNIPYELLLDPQSRQELAVTMNVPESIFALAAEEIRATMYDPFYELRAHLTESAIAIVRRFYGMSD